MCRSRSPPWPHRWSAVSSRPRRGCSGRCPQGFLHRSPRPSPPRPSCPHGLAARSPPWRCNDPLRQSRFDRHCFRSLDASQESTGVHGVPRIEFLLYPPREAEVVASGAPHVQLLLDGERSLLHDHGATPAEPYLAHLPYDLNEPFFAAGEPGEGHPGSGMAGETGPDAGAIGSPTTESRTAVRSEGGAPILSPTSPASQGRRAKRSQNSPPSSSPRMCVSPWERKTSTAVDDCASTAGSIPSNRAAMTPRSPSQSISSASSTNWLKEECVSSCTAFAIFACSSTSRKTVLAVSLIGCSLKFASAMTPSVPREPVNSLERSYPATFLTTLPPAFATVPSASTTFTPMIRSLIVPYLRRLGPEEFAATIPPTVAPSSGGSTPSIWSDSARLSCRSCSCRPAWTRTI